MKPDVICVVELEKDKGGAPGVGYYSCPVYVTGHDSGFDCRMLLNDIELICANTPARIQICFLDPSSALQWFRVGTEFKVWEMGWIGKGTVIETVSTNVSG
jgi:hypothetical protein